jgi:SAM-dependent methyltransferase
VIFAAVGEGSRNIIDIIIHDIFIGFIYNYPGGGLIGYYSEKLSSARLKLAYEIAPPRIRQYLRAEVDHVCSKLDKGDTIVDLGCGYGRTLPDFSRNVAMTVGIDTSILSLLSAQGVVRYLRDTYIACMDSVNLAFPDKIFDKVICIQNGISAFNVDQRELINEVIRIAKPGGMILFSTYSDKFWNERLEWFQLQARAGLLGEIDMEKTGDGVIVCKDGFRATTFSREDFVKLTSGLNVEVRIVEIDDSSLFCEIDV